MKLIESKTLSATNMIFGKNSLEENKEETIKLACVTDNTELIWTSLVKKKRENKRISSPLASQITYLLKRFEVC